MADWAAFVRRRLSLTALTSAREAEIVEEIARQLDDAYRDAMAAGASEPEARALAERHVPDWDALATEVLRASSRGRRPALEHWSARADEARAPRPFRAIDRLRQDLIFGWRLLVRARGLTLAAILTLALGIGANTAIFSVLHALAFTPLPVPEARQLVALTSPDAAGMMTGIESGDRTLLSYAEFRALADGHTRLDGLAAFGSATTGAPVTTPGESETRSARISLVSSSFFPMLRLTPALGATFGPHLGEVRLAHPVAVVSHDFWTTRLSGRADAIGGGLRIRDTMFTIVGVTPAGFDGLVVGDPAEVWVPLTMQEAIAPGRDWLTQPPGSPRRTMFLHVVGRVPPGVDLAAIDEAANRVFAQALAREAAGIGDADRRRNLTDARLVVRPVRFGLSPLRGEYRDPLTVLMALVGLLLLLTCANVATLQLARSSERQREIALRIALGAGRLRLLRQLLTESVLLAALGGVAGLLVAYWGVPLLLRLASGDRTPMPIAAGLDGVVLAFAASLVLIVGVGFGLGPAIGGSRLDLQQTLRTTAPTTGTRSRRGGHRRWPVGHLLATGQVALSLVLLTAAALFVRSLSTLHQVPLGYEADDLVLFRVAPVGSRGGLDGLFESLRARLEAVPGVGAATFSYNGLFYGSDLGADVSWPGLAEPPHADMSTRFDLVAPGYFRAVGLPLRAGRDVEPADATGLPGCWINETATRDFFGTRSPIGQRVVAHFSFGDLTFEVRGVVGDGRSSTVREAPPRRVYLPFLGSAIEPRSAVFVVRTAVEPARVIPDLRRMVQAADPSIGTPTFSTVPELIGFDLGRDRVTARLSSLFGALSLALSAFGLFGVLTFTVSRRSREIGVRLALGARSREIVELIARDAAAIVLVGGAAGAVAAIAGGRLIESQLFGVTARDPLAFAAAAALLAVVAAAAVLTPTLRALRTDPLITLRGE